jgi:glycosyltransferase involved in cell wall biosynthesis
VTIYLRNFLDYIKRIRFKANLTWIYPGKINRAYNKNGIRYIEIKKNLGYPLEDLGFNLKVLSIIKKEHFDIINSHAIWGYWMAFYKKNQDQKIINTYHGTSYYYIKNHMKRFNLLKRIVLLPLKWFYYIIELPPMKKADKIICVSNKVRDELTRLYKIKRDMEIVRAGVDNNIFKPRDRTKIRKKLKLKESFVYGLYVGRGGYFTKGLDRVIRLSEKIYSIDRDYRLIIIGADRKKVQHLIKKEFIIFIPDMARENLKDYYNASDVFFCMSRYEGGAPTLVTSEAMASGCLIACSKDSRPEVIEDEKNGLLLSEDYEREARRTLEVLENKKMLKNLLSKAQATAKILSIDNFGKKYLNALIN